MQFESGRTVGHRRHLLLPRTRRWQQILELLDSGASLREVADATMRAAERAIHDASNDPAFVHTMWLLMRIPVAACQKGAFSEALHRIRLDVSAEPDVFEIVAAFSEAVDRHARERGGRTDLGEMAQMAAAESLTAFGVAGSQDLFDVTPDTVRQGFRDLARKGFGPLARDFYSRFLNRLLGFYVDREIADRVGQGRRFEDLKARMEFSDALALHCRETSKVVLKYASDWYGREQGRGPKAITQHRAGVFAYGGLHKLVDELQQRAAPDG